VLVADDQLINQAGILALETRGDSQTLLPNLVLSRSDRSLGEIRAKVFVGTHLFQLDDKIAAEVAVEEKSFSLPGFGSAFSRPPQLDLRQENLCEWCQ
jgi:hypothetical protein